jgi:hypothetical protein
MHRPTDEELFESLHKEFAYDPETGVMTRTVRTSHRVKVGDFAGSMGLDGYYRVMHRRKLYLVHRLVWVMMTGKMPIKHMDHINGIRSDNRFCNLREATHSENMRNRPRFKSSKSGLKGAKWHKGQQKWTSCIRVQGKEKWLGTFESKEEAHAAYCAAAAEYHKEFAHHG